MGTGFPNTERSPCKRRENSDRFHPEPSVLHARSRSRLEKLGATWEVTFIISYYIQIASGGAVMALRLTRKQYGQGCSARFERQKSFLKNDQNDHEIRKAHLRVVLEPLAGRMPVREPNGLFDYIVEKMSATSP